MVSTEIKSYVIIEERPDESPIPLREAEMPNYYGLCANIIVYGHGKVDAHYYYRTSCSDEYYLGRKKLDVVEVKGIHENNLYKTKHNGWKDEDGFLADFIDRYSSENILDEANSVADEYIDSVKNTISVSEYIEFSD